MPELADKPVPTSVHKTPPARRSGKTIALRIGAVLVIAILAVAGYVIWKQLQKFETTDDAEMDGSIYAISSRVTGHVTEVPVEDEQYVKAGEVLARLDPTDFKSRS